MAKCYSSNFIIRNYILIISITGIRELIIKAIPNDMKYVVSAWIGLFIAFIGLKNAGIVVANPSTFVALGNLADKSVLISLFGLAVIAIFLGIIITVIAGVVTGVVDAPTAIVSMPPSMAPTFGVAI